MSGFWPGLFQRDAGERKLGPMTNFYLFLMSVSIWGSTWIAITFQLGKVAPEASVSYRFLLATLILFMFCSWRRLDLRFGLRQHLALFLQGSMMFSLSYICIYYAESLVVSGLVAVGFSATPLLNMMGVRMVFGTPMSLRIALGALLGIAGIVIVFLPELTSASAGEHVVRGALYTALGVVTSAVGAVTASGNTKRGVPVWQAMAFAMLYGSICSLAFTLVTGKTLGFDWSLSYTTSLLYLAVLGSIVAFTGYFMLLERIGAARAGYIGVMVPIVALVISAVFEGFVWRAETYIGAALSIAGNIVILRRA